MDRVLYVVDQFADVYRSPEERHPGGAELVDQALLEAAPICVEPIRWSELREHHVREFPLLILGNMQTARAEMIKKVAHTGRHILMEHDVRICRWRGNFFGTDEFFHRCAQRCLCAHPELHELYDRSLGSIFYTHRQLEAFRRNPFYRSPRELVLGCPPMNQSFFDRVREVSARRGRRKRHCCVIYSFNEIKGTDEATRYCQEQGVVPFVIRNRSPENVLDDFADCEEFVYLPKGLEAGGRTLVEARFLGCSVVTNANAGVCGESWWHLGDELALAVVRDSASRFWRLVDSLVRDAPERSPLSARRLGSRRALAIERVIFAAGRVASSRWADRLLGSEALMRRMRRDVFARRSGGTV